MKNFGRKEGSATVNITQQPKTKPDDAFGILGLLRTQQHNENESMRLVTQRRY
jgi:hypothetical protein